MSNNPAVTIMIPVFNQAGFVAHALQTALAQDYPNLEIVIADDGSTDNIEMALGNHISDNRVRYHRNPINLGRVANYKNTLERVASGEWVLNLDGDDYLTDPSFISRAMQHIKENDIEQIVFLQAGHSVMTDTGKTIRADLPVIDGTYKVLDGKQYFLEFHHFSHLATLFNRKKAIALDFYKYDILSADIECFLRLALQGKVILMRESIGVWVHHGSNESKKLTIEAVEKNMLRIEGPYAYAKSLGIIPENTLLQWRKQMTRNYITYYLSKSLKKGSGLRGYFNHVKKFYPKIFFSSASLRALYRAWSS